MKKNTAPIGAAKKQVYKLTCQNPACGKEFETVIYWRRFCSNACRQAEFQRRRKLVSA